LIGDQDRGLRYFDTDLDFDFDFDFDLALTRWRGDVLPIYTPRRCNCPAFLQVELARMADRQVRFRDGRVENG